MKKNSPPHQIPNRIREIRKRQGMTLERLAELTELSVSYLSRLESGKRILNAKQMPKIANALGVKPVELIDSATASLEVDITGIITDDHEIIHVTQNPGIRRNHSAIVPAALVLHEITMVVGNGMAPRYDDGDIITFVWQDDDISDLIGKECVVTLTNGRSYIKTLVPGTKPKHFHLSSFNSPTTYDVEVTRVARISWINRA